MVLAEHPGDVGEQPERIIDVTWEPGCCMSVATFLQSARCTETPAPRVTKPTMSSPGTGVQHFASLTSTSASPRTRTPLLDDAGRWRTEFGSASASSCSATSVAVASSFSITDCVETCPSPIAA